MGGKKNHSLSGAERKEGNRQEGCLQLIRGNYSFSRANMIQMAVSSTLSKGALHSGVVPTCTKTV